MKRVIVLVAAGLLFLVGAPSSLLAQEWVPTITSLYTGPDGLAYLKEIPVTYDQLTTIAGGMRFARMPPPAPGATLQFHVGPQRQYAVTLSGSAEIVTSGGQKFLCDRDHILLVEDLTGKGHTVKVLGPGDWVRIFLEVDERKPAVAR